MMSQVIVLDATGQRLSPCSPQKAHQLLAQGRARLVSEDPFTIQLPYAVSLRPMPAAPAEEKPGEGKRLLLHICCGPCSTYSIQRLRGLGFEVTGLWYNPNIHPFAEHERRRACMQAYATEIALPMIWEAYEMPAYFRAVAGHETFGERCAICYRLRLERTAQIAQQQGFDAFTTTLLISPYQQQALIRHIGEELASQYGVSFYFENLRRGWSERGHMAREHGMYQQRYCGCIYSEWEAALKSAK
jgi:predicted adenine nucleotide alpha hydrolase (AANH) superfamily ATPase